MKDLNTHAAHLWMSSAACKRRSSYRYPIRCGKFFIECDSSQHLPRILVDLDFGRNLADIVLALKLHRSRRLLRASVKARQGSFRASPTCFNNLFYSIRALTGAHCSRPCILSVNHTELQHTKVWIQGWSPR